MTISKSIQSSDFTEAMSPSVKVILCFEGDDPRTHVDEIANTLCAQVAQDLRSCDREYHATLEMILHSNSLEEGWDLASYVLIEFADVEQFRKSVVTLQLMDCGYKGAFHYDPTICKSRWAPIVSIARALLSIEDLASDASVDVADLAIMAPDLIDGHSSKSIQKKLSRVRKPIDGCHENLEVAVRTAVSEARIV